MFIHRASLSSPLYIFSYSLLWSTLEIAHKNWLRDCSTIVHVWCANQFHVNEWMHFYLSDMTFKPAKSMAMSFQTPIGFVRLLFMLLYSKICIPCCSSVRHQTGIEYPINHYRPIAVHIKSHHMTAIMCFAQFVHISTSCYFQFQNTLHLKTKRKCLPCWYDCASGSCNRLLPGKRLLQSLVLWLNNRILC